MTTCLSSTSSSVNVVSVGRTILFPPFSISVLHFTQEPTLNLAQRAYSGFSTSWVADSRSAATSIIGFLLGRMIPPYRDRVSPHPNVEQRPLNFQQSSWWGVAHLAHRTI